jgi:CRP-like cAMP-binding protein
LDKSDNCVLLLVLKKSKKGEIIYFSSSDLPRIFLSKKGNIKIVAVDEDGNETIKDTKEIYLEIDQARRQ